MRYEIAGDPAEIIRGFEQFLQEVAPEKPRRNHMVMVAEHIIHALQVDQLSTHKLTADVDVANGVFILTLTKL